MKLQDWLDTQPWTTNNQEERFEFSIQTVFSDLCRTQWRLSPLHVTQFYHSRCHSLCCKAPHTKQCFLTWNTGDQKPCWRSQILQSCTMSSYRYPIILTSETGLISVETDHYSNQAFIAQIVQLSDAFSERNTFLWELRLIKFFGEHARIGKPQSYAEPFKQILLQCH